MSEQPAFAADITYMRVQRIASIVVAGTLVVTGLSASIGVSTAAAATDPATNVPASPAYWSTCADSGPASSTCTSAVLAAVNHARSLEGVGPMMLPAGFASLTPAQQTFVVSNLERVDRGLQPAAGMVATLDNSAQTGANNEADPTLASWTIGPFNANRWGSNWAGDLNALAADYDWMYADGWGPNGSFNMDCTGPGAAGCWGHRHNILSTYGGEKLITGTGYARKSQWTSIAQIFVAGSGSYPPFVMSWAAASSRVAAPPPGVTATPTAGQHATAATIGTTTTVVAGHTASVTGHIVDAETGLPMAGTGVLLCHRTAVEATGSCSSALTDTSGSVRTVVRPVIRTEWWIAYTGGSANAAASSRANSIFVKNAVGLRVRRATRGWLLLASFAPVRGQTVRLQVRTAIGWKTLVKTPLRQRSMSFHVSRGRYRVWVAGVKGLLDNYAYAAAR